MVATPTPAMALHTPLIKKIYPPLLPIATFFLVLRVSPLTAVLDSFASDSKFSRAVEVTADARAERIPGLFQSGGICRCGKRLRVKMLGRESKLLLVAVRVRGRMDFDLDLGDLGWRLSRM